jgi:predicted RNA-binding protein (virulence factor B family)
MNVLVLSKTPLGYKVIVENLYEGMLFDNEIFETLKVGDRKIAYVKNIRNDGKLDLTLQPIGKKVTGDVFEAKLLSSLKNRDGFIALNSKSDAEAIMKMFGLSKKSFKRTLTSLTEQKKVVLKGEGIALV